MRPRTRGRRPTRVVRLIPILLASCLLVVPSRSVLARDAAAAAVDDRPARATGPVVAHLPPAANVPDPVEVRVRVAVGATGDVLATEVLDGPVELSEAADDAVRAATFEAAVVDGVPVESTVVVEVRFLPTTEDDDAPVISETVEVIADRADVEVDDTHARAVITAKDLDRSAGSDLGEAVAAVPGVASSRGTADTSKPIIRGQQERRLLLLSDGVRHESQKWGADHAPEIDPMAAGDIQVVKGAAGVRYGPDAIGGVVVVNPPPMRSAPGVGGKARLLVVSNGFRLLGGLRLDGAPARLPGLSFRVEGNYARGAAARAPDYVLGNTASQAWNAGGAVQLQRGAHRIRLTYRHYDLRAGICYCTHAGTPADFLASLDRPQPIGADRWTADFDIGRPKQEVTHDVVTLHWTADLRRAGTLRLVYSFQVNHRLEYEHARASIQGPQYDFLLRTHHLDATIQQPRAYLGAAVLEGEAGLGASAQDNVYAGLPLVPNHRSFGFDVYGVERLRLPRGLVEVGGRFDHQVRTSFLTESAFGRHVSRGTLTEDACERDAAAVRCRQSWSAGSLSVGALVRPPGDKVELRLDLSSASRFPNGDELYMNGSAPTSPVYALGDPSLGPETTWGASPTLRLQFAALEAEASGYVNYIDDYIYFAPDLAANGAPRFDVTIRGAYPRFLYQPIDALFYGFDGSATLGPRWPVSATVHAAVVRAIDLADGAGLVSIPPDRFGGTVTIRPPPTGLLSDMFLDVSGEYVLEQTHVAPGADLAPPPPAYTLIGAGLGATIALKRFDLTLALEVNDILNRPHRDYTSLLRYYADDPGREFRFRVDVDF